MKARNVLSFALALAGCQRAAPATLVPVSAASSGGAAPGASAPSPPLVARLREIEQQLGGGPVRLLGVVAHGYITHAAAVTTPVDVPANACLSLVALGSTGVRDLDAHLFDPSGDVLVEDVETDPHPTVQLCASTPRRVYHMLEAYEGNGAYLVAAFATDRGGLNQIARVMGGHPATAPGAGGERSEIERRINELRDGIARRGFQPSGEPTRADYAAAGAVRVPLVVTPDRCYTVAAVADASVRDANLAVYDAQGELIARDERPAQDAVLQLCPAVSGPLSVEVRAVTGPGTVVLQAFSADAATLGGASALWLGERLAWGARAESLDATAPQVARDLTTMGYTPTGDANGRGAQQPLAPGETREVAVRAEAGRCTAVAAIAGRGVAGVRVEVFDARGDLTARGARHGAATVAVVCPTAAEELRAVVSAASGSGPVMVRTFQNAAPPAWVAGVDRVAVSEAMADAWARADGGWRAEGTPEKIRIGAGSRRVRDVDRASGECVRWTASAGRGLPWVSIALRGANGDRVAWSSGEGTAVVTRCGGAAERLQLEVRTDPAAGPEVDAVLSRAVRSESRAAADAPR